MEERKESNRKSNELNWQLDVDNELGFAHFVQRIRQHLVVNVRALPQSGDCSVVEGAAALRSSGGRVHPDGNRRSYIAGLVFFFLRAASVAQRRLARRALHRKMDRDVRGSESNCEQDSHEMSAISKIINCY